MNRTMIILGGALYALLCIAVFILWLPKDVVFVGDSAIYSRAAVNVALHGFYSVDAMYAYVEREPFYSVFLAAIYAVFGNENGIAVFTVQCSLYFFAVAYFVAELDRMVSRRCAAFSYVLLLTSPSVLHALFILYRESFTLSLLLLLTAGILAMVRKPSVGMAIVVGIFLGVLPLTYYSFVFLPILLILYLWSQGIPRKHLLLIVFLALALLASWALRNARIDGRVRIIGSDRTAVMWYVRAEQAEKIHGLEPLRCLWSEYVSRDWTGRSEACSFNGVMHARWPDGAVGIDASVAPESRARIFKHFWSYVWFSLFEILELHFPFVGGGWPFAFNVLAALGSLIVYAGCLLAWRSFFDRRFVLFTVMMLYTTAVFSLTDATPRYLVPVLFCYCVIAACGFDCLLRKFSASSRAS